MVHSLRWIVAAALFGIGAWIIAENALEAWRCRRRGQNYSWVPFVGGAAAALGVCLAPVGTLAQRTPFAAFSAASDLTYLMAVIAAASAGRRAWRRSRSSRAR